MIGPRNTAAGHTRRKLRPRLAALLTGLVGAVAAWPAEAAPDQRHTTLRCDRASMLCLLMRPDRDSDGDGWSDLDERAAGSDPYDASSRPRVAQILTLTAQGVHTSLRAGHAGLFVPPTHTPDGRALATFGPAGLLASQQGFPARTAALQRLGIDPSAMARAGIPPTSGLLLMPGEIVGQPARIQTPGAGTFTMMRLRMGQMAAGDDLAPLGPATAVARHVDPDGPPTSVTVTDTGAVVSTFGDGSTVYNHYTHGGGGSVHSTVHRDKDGNTTGVRTFTTEFSTDSAGNEQMGTGHYGQTRDDEGNLVVETGTSTDTSHPDGSRTTNFTNVAVTKKGDGSQIVDTVVGHVEVKPDGSGSSKHVHKVEKKDAQGNVVSSASTTTETKTDSNGKQTKTTHCAADSEAECPTGQYVDPEAAYSNVVITTADVARMVDLMRSKVTRQGTPVLQYVDPKDAEDPKAITPMAWFDPEGRLLVMASTPDIWNNNSGTENFGKGGGPIDLTLKPLPEPPLDHAAGQAFMAALGALVGAPVPRR